MAQWLMQNLIVPYPYFCLGILSLLAIIGSICSYQEFKQAIQYSLSKHRFQTQLKKSFPKSEKNLY